MSKIDDIHAPPAELWLLSMDSGYGWVLADDDIPGTNPRLAFADRASAERAARHLEETVGIRSTPVQVVGRVALGRDDRR